MNLAAFQLFMNRVLSGHWSLVIGYWSLVMVIGNCSLEVRNWLLGAGQLVSY